MASAPRSLFNVEQTTTTPSKPREWAQKLWTTLDKKQRVKGSSNFNRWVERFALLRDKQTDEDIANTLSWYCSALLASGKHPKFLPQAFSANSFYLKFEQLKQARLRHGDDTPAKLADSRARKSVTRMISDALLEPWPSPIQVNDVLDMATTSYLNYSRLLANLSEFVSSGELQPDQARKPTIKLAQQLEFYLPPVSTFIRRWVDDQRQTIQRWTKARNDSQAPDLKVLAFHLHSEKFRLDFPILKEWDGSGETWEQLKEELSNEG